MDFVTTRPPRCVLANVTSGETFECLFNPGQLLERVSVGWNRLIVPGLDHQPLQFQSTGNRQLVGVEFYLDRLFAAAQPSDADILTFRGFLRALTIPPSAGQAPPRLLVVWPSVITIEAVLTDLELAYRQVGLDGSPLVYTATCTLEEIVDERRRPEDLR